MPFLLEYRDLRRVLALVLIWAGTWSLAGAAWAAIALGGLLLLSDILPRRSL